MSIPRLPIPHSLEWRHGYDRKIYVLICVDVHTESDVTDKVGRLEHCCEMRDVIAFV